MSKSMTAALLSGLIFPGVGHLYLKSHGRGIALLVLSAICFFVLMAKVFDQANAVLQKVQAEGGIMDPARILAVAAEMAAQTPPPAADTTALGVATLGLIACWVIGVVDAYRLGKR